MGLSINDADMTRITTILLHPTKYHPQYLGGGTPPPEVSISDPTWAFVRKNGKAALKSGATVEG